MSSLAEMIQRHEKLLGEESLHYAATPRHIVQIGGDELFSGPVADARLYVFSSLEGRARFLDSQHLAFAVTRDQARVAAGLQNFAPRFEK